MVTIWLILTSNHGHLPHPSTISLILFISARDKIASNQLRRILPFPFRTPFFWRKSEEKCEGYCIFPVITPFSGEEVKTTMFRLYLTMQNSRLYDRERFFLCLKPSTQCWEQDRKNFICHIQSGAQKRVQIFSVTHITIRLLQPHFLQA